MTYAEPAPLVQPMGHRQTGQATSDHDHTIRPRTARHTLRQYGSLHATAQFCILLAYLINRVVVKGLGRKNLRHLD